ncbi:3-mercaptopyruvate sulfurtransferase SseA [Sulfuritortus calidifontis]|uniref:3-mercaptopyruvate sulfurtransferase SseA n=1 Tax=Sulfuritortus calidifontis TaxID=1914471 RepID=A0A4R3K0L9_9PROT|nr:rhodanese-like domain-containing protein [Sulfuritortus calidifontis]TCS73782.1 3-mercaptopyruvate sulfurtransferase SseA [Sulfuritortus calidifontis]
MKTQPTLLAVLLAAAFAAAPIYPTAALAADAPAIQAKEGWYKNLVDFEFMKQQVEIPPKKGVVIIDSRPDTRKFDPGHIPGAINIPDSKFDKMVDRLPADKNTLLIFYCEGVDCTLSHQSAAKAEKLGYTNIKVYPAGYPEWVAKGMQTSVSGAWLKKQLDEKAPLTVIDARPARVFEKGAIPGAINVPDSAFDKNLDKLPADKKAAIVVYCGGLECVLSNNVADKLIKLGYSNVKTYPEGYPEWSKLYASAPAKVAVEPGKEKGSISLASFERLLKENPAGMLIVDVRDAKEFAKGSLPGAVNIPIGQLEKQVDSLPKDKPTVFICGTGARAGEAYDMIKLLKAELPVHFLDAELKFQGDGKYTVKPN